MSEQLLHYLKFLLHNSHTQSGLVKAGSCQQGNPCRHLLLKLAGSLLQSVLVDSADMKLHLSLVGNSQQSTVYIQMSPTEWNTCPGDMSCMKPVNQTLCICQQGSVCSFAVHFDFGKALFHIYCMLLMPAVH